MNLVDDPWLHIEGLLCLVLAVCLVHVLYRDE